MLNLKMYAKLVEARTITDKDREIFKTVGFDPEELWQVKEMNEDELKLLMLFCGIRVYEDTPVIVMNEDEMRMAYVLWRADMVKEKKREVSKQMERGMKWTRHFLNAAKIWSHSI